MYDIAYGFAHTYFPLPSTERMRIEVARRGGGVSWKHFSHCCAVQFDAAAAAVPQHTALLRRMANIYNGNLVRAATPAVLLCCLGLHSDFEFLTSRSSFSTPPALHCYSALVYYIYTLQMYSVEGAISPCHLPGQKRSSLAIHNGGTTYTLVHGLKSSSGLDCVV